MKARTHKKRLNKNWYETRKWIRRCRDARIKPESLFPDNLHWLALVRIYRNSVLYNQIA